VNTRFNSSPFLRGFMQPLTRGKLLPIVYKLLNQKAPVPSTPPSYAELIQQNFNFNPLTCILCGTQMILTAVHLATSKASELLNYHRALALLKKI
jgi:hypothetical protein